MFSLRHIWIALLLIGGAALAGPAYPVKVSSNGRYLVDQNGQPFLIVGDTPQQIMNKVSLTDGYTFITNKAAHGFNALQVMVFYDSSVSYEGTVLANSSVGGYPKLSDLNTNYLNRLATLVDMMATNGICAFICPTEWSANAALWRANGTNNAYRYGTNIAAFFASRTNIVWMHGNDFQDYTNTSDRLLIQNVMQGIHDVDTNHLQTIILAFHRSTTRWSSELDGLSDFSSEYTYYPVYGEAAGDYQKSPTKPTFLGEGHYEFENTGPSGGEATTALLLREQAWWGSLSGNCGQIYGSYYSWGFPAGWQTHLETDGVRDVENWRNFMTNHNWQVLVPDLAHTVLTSGYGTSDTNSQYSGNNYAVCAAAADGTEAVIYSPTTASRDLTIDLTQFSCSVTSRWYDVAGGGYTSISGSPFANTGSHTFTTPSTNNSGGDTDWVLLLEAATGTNTLIPVENQTDWTPGVYVGVPGGFAQYSNRTVVMVTNLDTTGATDVSSGLQAFIDNATSGTILQLTNGTYRCDSALYFGESRDGITLRGNGPSTIIDSRSTSYSFYIGIASDYTWSWPSSGNTITAGVSKGSTNVTISDTSQFSVGKMIHFVFVNGTNADEPVISVYNFEGMRRQKCRVTAKTGTTLTFWPPLYDNYRADGAKVFVAQFQTDNVGLEDFTLVCSNGPAQMGIEWEQCVGCWAKGVRVKSAINYPFFLYDSLNCEITQCYADQRNGEGSNGAGVLCNTSSGCYVYNNIAYKFFPIIEVNHGSCGNVFAYNFCHDSTVFGGEGAGIDSNHGPHNSFNLYEGNIAPSIQCDGYFGSASKDTLYRNWFHGTDPGLGFGFAHAFNRFTRKYAMVGNLFGVSGSTAGYSFGNPNMGNSCYVGTASHINGPDWIDWTNYLAGNYTNGVVDACVNPDSGHGFIELDLDVSNTTFRVQNYLSGVGIPSDEQTNVTLSASAYLSGTPTWWPNTLTYPPISLSLTNTISESTLTNGDYLLPAQVAFYNGGVWPGESGGGTASRPGAIVKGKATIKNNLRQR